MTPRAWATLAVRCFAIYHIVVSAAYILWIIGARFIGGGTDLRSMPDSGPELVSSILYSVIYLAMGVTLLALSDGIIRFIARVPGEPAEKAG